MVEQSDPETQERARLFGVAPVKDMERRGWITPSRHARTLEAELCRFFQVPSLDEPFGLEASARQPLLSDEFTAAQRAWLFRAAQLASVLHTRPFHAADFEAGLSGLRQLAGSAERVGQVTKGALPTRLTLDDEGN